MTNIYTARYLRTPPLGKQEKWCTIGKAFETKEGISLVLDSIPLDKSWNGSIMLFKEEPK